jgi:hypothetical protein
LTVKFPGQATVMFPPSSVIEKRLAGLDHDLSFALRREQRQPRLDSRDGNETQNADDCPDDEARRDFAGRLIVESHHFDFNQLL